MVSVHRNVFTLAPSPFTPVLQIHGGARIRLHLHHARHGAIGSGVVELIASLLLFTPRLVWLGAGLALGTMAGAIGSHLTVLGIEVQGDGGTLFALAVVTALCSAFVLFQHRSSLPVLGPRFFGKPKGS